MNQERVLRSGAQASELSTNKVLRNTYMLLSMTLLFSAAMAAVSMVLQVGPIASFVCFFGGIGALFGVYKFADRMAGLWLTFLFTGLFGFSLGPILNQYLAMLSNGGQIITMALGGTGVIFLGLSGYVLTTKKDFSFLGGFLAVGTLMALGGVIVTFFVNVPVFSLALSGVIILLMSGWILFDTSRIIHGGETNYIRATVSLFVNIFNLFVHLLHLLAAFAGER